MTQMVTEPVAAQPTDRSLDDLAVEVQKRFQTADLSLGAMESCTGGLVASTLTDIPKSGYLLGGLICYDTHFKIACGVPPSIIERHGVVSAATAQEMAKAAAEFFQADFGIATTGVAGPDPEDGIPAGTVHVGVFGRARGAHSRLIRIDGTRSQVKQEAVRAALELLITVVSGARRERD
jgi:PncC family amidohydrolase